jgi:hypothetical protein
VTTDFLKSSTRPFVSESGEFLSVTKIADAVHKALVTIPFIDIHTHLFAPSFGKLSLWGIDELLTYHYLEAELFRSSEVNPEHYWALSKSERADLIWRTLFVENSPISEATRGVIAVLRAFGLPTHTSALPEARAFFKQQSLESHVPRVLQMAGLDSVVMTNDPLDLAEVGYWLSGVSGNRHFHAVLRLDRVLNTWSEDWQSLEAQGYSVDAESSGSSISEVRRFLADWHKRMHPVYMACSLPDTFEFPHDSINTVLLREAVLPACREFGLPLSLMIGVRKQVNSRIRLAGDGVGRANLRAVENLCRDFPTNRFLVSVLSRENQHELCVLARKFNNLLPFGCWWFMNNTSIVEEITRERIEMLGTSFIPQHSDARVLEQVIYKWSNTRRILANILSENYRLLSNDGRGVTQEAIRRDITRLFRTNAEAWMTRGSRP